MHDFGMLRVCALNVFVVGDVCWRILVGKWERNEVTVMGCVVVSMCVYKKVLVMQGMQDLFTCVCSVVYLMESRFEVVAHIWY